MATPYDYVIVGGGAAAAAAAEEIRRRDQHGTVAVFTREWAPPYQRPPLSKEYLQGRAGIDAVLLQPPSWYLEHQVAVHVGTEITAVDPERHEVLAGEQHVAFRHLLLATGARPRTLDVRGADLEGVCLLRTYLDAERLRGVRASAARIVVLGSGFIGMEVAASLRSGGSEVVVVTVDHALYQPFGSEVSRYAADLFNHHGVEVRLRSTLRSIDGSGRVSGVTLDDGTRIDAQAVIIGIGVTPEVTLAASAGLRVDGGIVVDDRLQTSQTDIFAAGDAARFPSLRGTLTRVEHFDHAFASGAAAGANMTGANEAYRYVPFFWSDVFELGFEFVGETTADARLAAGSLDSGSFVVEYHDGPRLAGALLASRSSEERDGYRSRVSGA